MISLSLNQNTFFESWYSWKKLALFEEWGFGIFPTKTRFFNCKYLGGTTNLSELKKWSLFKGESRGSKLSVNLYSTIILAGEGSLLTGVTTFLKNNWPSNTKTQVCVLNMWIFLCYQGSISPTFYKQLLCAQIPKAQKAA